MWLLHFFMKKPDATAPNSRISLASKSRERYKEGTLTSFCEVVNYPLESYVTDDLIAEIDTKIMCYTQPVNKTPVSTPIYFGLRRSDGTVCMISMC